MNKTNKINFADQDKNNTTLNECDEKSIDEILEEADRFGRYKIVIHLSSYYLFLVLIYHFVLSFFTGSDPPWKCLSNNSSIFCKEHYNESISPDRDVFKQRCNLNRTEWTYTTAKSYSFVTEFDLICDKTTLAALISGSYYIGGVIGAAVSGTIADTYGRRPVIIFSIILTSVSSIGCMYIRNIWQIFLLNVLRGTGSTGCYYTTLIYVSEFATPTYRSISTNILLIFGSLSFLFIDIIAYFIRNWRQVTAYTGWLSIPICIVFCFLPESPRWLLASGKKTEAKIVMDKICKFKDNPTRVICLRSPNSSDDTKHTYLDLIRTCKILRLTVSNICVWFVLPVLYYSIALQSSSFGGNMYEAYALSTVADIPGCLLFSYLGDRFGRKKSILSGCFLSGILLGSMALVPKSLSCRYTINIIISFLARFTCCISLFGMYTWSLELFPTVLRSQGMSLCAISDRLGMFIVPFITRVCQKVNYKVPFIIMCASAICASVIGLWLPETLNQPTRETFQDFFHNASFERDSGVENTSLERDDVVESKSLEHDGGVDNATVQIEDVMV